MVTRSTATVPVTVDAHSAEVGELAELRAQEKRLTLERARVKSARRGPITRKINEIREQMTALEDTIESGKVLVTVTALARGRYRNLLKDHPPREDDEVEAKVGYNLDTFGAALIRACTVSATRDGEPYDLDLDDLLDEDTGVGAYDFEQWFRTCLALQTQGGNRVPLLRAS